MPPQCLAARAVSLALALPRPIPALADPAPPHNLPNQQLRMRLFIPRFDAIPERRRRELFLEYYNLLAEAGALPAAAAGSAAAGPGGGSGGGVLTTTGDLAAAEEDAQLELLRQEQAKLKEEYDRWGGYKCCVHHWSNNFCLCQQLEPANTRTIRQVSSTHSPTCEWPAPPPLPLTLTIAHAMFHPPPAGWRPS